MNKMQKQVEEFHEAMGLTVGLTPAIRDHELRAKLILEEAVETVAAMGYSVRADIFHSMPTEDSYGTLPKVATFVKVYTTPNELDVIDGLCDLIYVVLGSAVTMGIDLEPFFNEVQRANMAKAGGKIREDGKQLKPEGWTPPDHAPILAKQRARAEAWRKAIEETEGDWLHPGDPEYPYDEVMPEGPMLMRSA